MIHEINYNYNLIACLEDTVIDWKAANKNTYWSKLFFLEKDLEDFFLPPIMLMANNVQWDVEE